MGNAVPIHIDIVSAEKQIYSGRAEMVVVSGELGELGIMNGHSPLITRIKPGQVHVVRPLDHQQAGDELYYVSGGVLEVQPDTVTILADTVVRAADLDEASAIAIRESAMRKMRERKTEFDFALATSELAEAAAQLMTIQRLRKKAKR